ncbi:DinB family protein [Sutcliffiella rhizosphaerae]|uniref:DinB-like domain-containing protein n=1 Tax=Sutcliffiella rhizosphaerae TaxID=2880967 RepID=A0ABM8YN44_9BACI|nr:DinB family protein [Sutcliffiella rhizosphaerae]CAG9621276.1 hypothetical protein BACCIP111883_02048 [Sutcliffiella rhizosphaerae]
MQNEKEIIIRHHEAAIAYAHSLKCISNAKWRTSIGDGKWTVAEVIGHLIPWDEFILEHRIPFLFSKSDLQKAPNVEVLNAESASNARNCEKDILLERFINSRKAVLEKVKQIPSDSWESNIDVGKTSLSLYDYFQGLVKHDLHHFTQIDKVLKTPSINKK